MNPVLEVPRAVTFIESTSGEVAAGAVGGGTAVDGDRAPVLQDGKSSGSWLHNSVNVFNSGEQGIKTVKMANFMPYFTIKYNFKIFFREKN